MARQVVIVGGGKVGTYLASLLLAAGHQGTVIETHLPHRSKTPETR
jgi:2-polyprenyl-6-methoxyphenol hydroxylase-like FAD-dependent oxidoreductase